MVPDIPVALAIHEFHKINRQKGGHKNRGPRDLSGESFQGWYGSMPNERLIEFQKAVKNGQIDVNHTYLIM
jgi:hypothetical protein